eukprot:148539-Chlamydomonas_euryale.AAC.2
MAALFSEWRGKQRVVTCLGVVPGCDRCGFRLIYLPLLRTSAHCQLGGGVLLLDKPSLVHVSKAAA